MFLQRSVLRVCKGCRGITDVRHPKAEDMLWLMDMPKSDFQFVSAELGRDYMEPATETPTFPVKGMIHNEDYGRRCVCMVVEYNNKKVWVPFVINGGSPNTLLGADALVALGINPNDVHGGLSVTIHGHKSLGASFEAENRKLRDINVIGWNYFRRTKNFEVLDPETMELTLYKNIAQFRELNKASK